MTDTAARQKLQLNTKPDTPTREARARRMPLDTREFKMPDGRPVTINRFAVSFCCPAKDEPETKTVVGVKGAASAMPLAIPYDEFKAWWQQKGPTTADLRAKIAALQERVTRLEKELAQLKMKQERAELQRRQR